MHIEKKGQKNLKTKNKATRKRRHPKRANCRLERELRNKKKKGKYVATEPNFPYSSTCSQRFRKPHHFKKQKIYDNRKLKPHPFLVLVKTKVYGPKKICALVKRNNRMGKYIYSKWCCYKKIILLLALIRPWWKNERTRKLIK